MRRIISDAVSTTYFIALCAVNTAATGHFCACRVRLTRAARLLRAVPEKPRTGFLSEPHMVSRAAGLL